MKHTSTQQPEALNLEEFRAKVTRAARESLFARITELEAQLAAVQQGVQAAVPDNWRDQFSEAVYEDLSAADNQDVPLEEYPARILNVLDAIVGPRHPAVIKWRNDAIRSCITIAYKYCNDPESYRYLKQDFEAMLTSEPAPQQWLDAQTIKHISALSELVRMPNAEHFADAHNAAVRHLRALASQAKLNVK